MRYDLRSLIAEAGDSPSTLTYEKLLEIVRSFPPSDNDREVTPAPWFVAEAAERGMTPQELYEAILPVSKEEIISKTQQAKGKGK